MNDKINKRIISPNSTLIAALKLMDTLSAKLLLVVDNDNFVGLLSIGDIQRAIINQTSLDSSLTFSMRNEFEYACENESVKEIKEKMLLHRMEFCPVISEDNHLVDVYFWEDMFNETIDNSLTKFNVPIVIMAGGLGTRLQPLTNVFPKPLIPIGEKTVVEEIMDRFYRYGCSKFYLSVNYKRDIIEFYLDKQNLPFELEYFEEPKPLGTAGSLFLLKNKLHSTFIVSNCDILINQDYSEILRYHQENKCELTIVAVVQFNVIPYGTVEVGKDGFLHCLNEKPQSINLINSGMYVLEPQLLGEIEDNQFMHITELIEKVKNRGGRVGVYPINQGDWNDMGEWDKYLNIIKQ